MIRLLVIVALSVAFAAMPVVDAPAQSATADPPGFASPTAAPIADLENRDVLFQADEVRYDNALNRVVAVGNVEIAQGQRVLLADELIFDRNADTVIASGNIKIIEPGGEVVFAEYVELRDELKSGSILGLRLLLTDDTRLAALSGRRYDDRFTEMNKAVMSPCDLCEDDPESPPLWQLKAYKIVHDEKKKNIEYHSAFLELLGVPVFYIPYLYHPDPSVERRTGLLTPSYGASDVLGVFIKTPVYLNLAEDMDATIEPIFMTKQGVIASGEFRKRFTFGQIEIRGSFGVLDRGDAGVTIEEDVFRGHIDAVGAFDVTDNIRAGFQIERVSDDTYLRRFDFNKQSVQTTNLYIEGFYGRSYASANAWAFQGLRSRDDADTTPVILPKIDYRFVGDADRWGGRLQIDANLLALSRREGEESRRASVGGEYRIPFIVGNGHLMTATAALRIDGYQTDGATAQSFTGRIFPQASVDWRYPLVKNLKSSQMFVQPQVNLSIAPNGGNPGEIVNEDSNFFELSDENLLERNRFQGLDRVDGGLRASVGVTAGWVSEELDASMFLGQGYRLDENNAFDIASGAREQIGDYVGRVRIDYEGWLRSLYRFRLDRKSLAPRSHEVDALIGPKEFRVGGAYLLVDDSAGEAGESEFGVREEATLTLASQISAQWRVDASYRRDLRAEQDRSWRAGVTFNNECVDFNAFFIRNFFRDRELEPSNTFGLRVTLKHLGEFGAGF